MSHLWSPPPEIPDYTLLRQIGQGSYGEVWLAVGVTGIYRAVKILYRERFKDSAPFEREFQGLRRFAQISLSTPGQLAILHIGRNDEKRFFYYVMELADDRKGDHQINPETYKPQTLRELLAGSKQLSIARCIEIGVSLSATLGALHENGLVHRDVKPSNIVFVNRVPKLADIGLVAAVSEELSVVGTEGYIAPEGPGRPTADIFALGRVLYELSTGLNRKDFPRLPQEISSREDKQELLELNEVLLKACHPRAEERYQSMDEMRHDLLFIQAGKSVRRLHLAERGLKRAARWALVLAAIAVIGVSGAFLERQRADRSERLLHYSALLTQVRNALDRKEFGFARAQLEKAKPLSREDGQLGFEWRALNELAQGDDSVIVRKSGPRIIKMGTDENQTVLAVHDYSAKVSLIDTDTYKLVDMIDGVGEFAGISPDGNYYLGATLKQKAAYWHRESDNQPIIFSDSEARQRPLGVSPEGKMVCLIESQQPALLICEPDQPNQIIKIPGLEEKDQKWELFRSAVSKEAKTVIAWVSRTRQEPIFKLTIWNDKDGFVHSDCSNRPQSVGFDARGAWACLDVSGIELRADSSGIFAPTGLVFPSRVSDRVVIDNDLQIVAHQNKVSWFKFGESEKIRTLNGHASYITDLGVSSKGIFASSSDGELRFWPTLNNDKEVRSYLGWNSQASGSALMALPQNEFAVREGPNKMVALSADSLEVRYTINEIGLPFGLRESKIYGITDHGISEVSIGSELKVRSLHSGQFRRAVLARESGEIYAIKSTGELYSIGIDASSALLEQHWQNRFDLVSSDSGDRIWATGSNHELVCFDTRKSRNTWSLSLESNAPELRLSDQEESILVILQNGQIEKRSAEDGELILSTPTGSAAPECLLVSDSLKRVFVGGREGEIHVLSLPKLQYLCALPLPQPMPIHGLALSEKGDFLAVLSKSGQVQSLPVPDTESGKTSEG